MPNSELCPVNPGSANFAALARIVQRRLLAGSGDFRKPPTLICRSWALYAGLSKTAS